MKVLVVTNMYPTEREPWFGCFVADQVEDLRGLGVDVEVLHFDGRDDPRNYLRAISELRFRVRDGFDLVHAHYGLTGAVALTQRRLPVVTTFHGSDTGYVRWQLRVSRLVARLTTPVFVDAGAAVRLGQPAAAVVPMGVDTDRFRPGDQSKSRHRLGWQELRRYVLLPGSRRNPVKGPDLFDAAIRETRDGIGVSLEGLARDKVALVMRAVDVTLVTSRSEGSPAAVKESLACGTPVVSVPVGDVPDVIAGLPGCEVCEPDPRALAAAVERAAREKDNPALRARVEQFSRPRTARRVLEVYRRAMGQDGAAEAVPVARPAER